MIGAGSIALSWAGLVFLITTWKGNASLTFSKHAAQTNGGQYFYMFLFALVLPAFYIFMEDWFVPELGLPTAFLRLVQAGVVCQLIALVFPATEGRIEKIHHAAAYGVALTMLPLMIMLAMANVPTAVKILAALSGVGMTLGWVLLLGWRTYWSQKLLPVQALYIAAFHLTILAASFSS